MLRFRSRIRDQRLALAATFGGAVLRWDRPALCDPSRDAQCSATAEIVVVLFGAADIGVAGDEDPELGVLRIAQQCPKLSQRRDRFSAQLILVEIEEQIA